MLFQRRVVVHLRIERGSIAHGNQTQTGNDEQNLMPGAGAPKRVGRCAGPEARSVGTAIDPPGETGVVRQAGVGGHRARHLAGNQLAAIPIALAHHQPTNSGGRVGTEISSAPIREQLKHSVRIPITIRVNVRNAMKRRPVATASKA